MTKVILSVICIMGSILISGCGPNKEEIEKANAEKVKLAAEQEAIIKKAKEEEREIKLIEAYKSRIELGKSFVEEELKDPQSAQYKNIRVHNDGDSYCVEINAKNSYGAYAGYEWITLPIPKLPNPEQTPQEQKESLRLMKTGYGFIYLAGKIMKKSGKINAYCVDETLPLDEYIPAHKEKIMAEMDVYVPK